MTEVILLINVLISFGLVMVCGYLWRLFTPLSAVCIYNALYLSYQFEDYGEKQFTEMNND